ncbi:hypothetical protein BU24DRAFT_278129 [Aaosphaeria arxii CBS 175.79]|uniref:Uncharacterized protein n=1 Tax=Aaosphaeria arxii CBS 175.79 TaxID=1450172 RepID=A0A6A5XEM9_9PLEO|nr:uncharacterized protein BU24DRAFT_278129 [Aaosphaeria arxii CBS 175.79]KAF2011301.1 hypothetical protein BU24DRAFT_278129 [Aaosphaeria arxii CBS 175.79]
MLGIDRDRGWGIEWQQGPLTIVSHDCRTHLEPHDTAHIHDLVDTEYISHTSSHRRFASATPEICPTSVALTDVCIRPVSTLCSTLQKHTSTRIHFVNVSVRFSMFLVRHYEYVVARMAHMIRH